VSKLSRYYGIFTDIRVLVCTLLFLQNLGKKEKKTKISRQLLDGKEIHQWAVSFIPALGGWGANNLTGNTAKTFAYFNRRLERPAPSSLSTRRFLPRRRRHGGSSCSRAANCSNSGTLEKPFFVCGRHGASAASAAHFVAYRSVMFAIVFFSSFLLLFATGRRSISLVEKRQENVFVV